MNPPEKRETPLARYMREARVGDNELSRRTGVPQPTITRYRRGQRRRPDETILSKLADELGVTVAELQGKDLGEDLPPEAVKIARLWLRLTPVNRKKFKTILETFQPVASDEQVSKHIPRAPKKR